MLQETWLLDFELTYLATLHPDFYARGISSINTCDRILSGRPHGGLAILWHKKLGSQCNIIDCNDNRLMVLEISTDTHKIIIVNVYLPCCSDDNTVNFRYYLGKIDSIIENSDTPFVYIMGDFNASLSPDNNGEISHKFGKILLDHCTDEGLLLSDYSYLPTNSTYTYCSEAHHRLSWLDHVMSTVSSHSLLKGMYVEYSTVTSDHHPLIMHIECRNKSVLSEHSISNKRKLNVIKWDEVAEDKILNYKEQTELNLNSVNLDHELLLCDDPTCTDSNHALAIDTMYSNIVSALLDASSDLVKSTKSGGTHVPGWNAYCKEAHAHARDAYVIWRSYGCPRHGFLFEEMKRTRAYFKCIFRKCKRDVTKHTADSIATKLLHKDDKSFWKEIKRQNDCSTSKSASTVNNVTGDQNIADMWHKHYKLLLNSSSDESMKRFVQYEIGKRDCLSLDRVTVEEISQAIKQMKNGKSSGLDNLYGEHFKNSHSKVHVLLSLLFNAMIIHGHLPSSFMDSIIVPLVKDKKGDITSVENYRPLAITSVASKIFEIILLERYSALLSTTDNQFGFKPKHSTEMCTFVLKQVIEYYTSLSSPVFICFLDASKAFNKVNHWQLFSKLIDRNVPHLIVRILVRWYTQQSFVVQWCGVLSQHFTVSNGVRQGGILSPILFNLYMDKLSCKLTNSRIGCHIYDTCVNHLFYADDSVIMAPSASALQKLLNICEQVASEHELSFNVKKTVCMCIKPKWLKDLTVPTFVLNNRYLSNVNIQKYLGIYITDTLEDDKDMIRQMKGIFARGNTLIKRFSQCSEEVKVKLFKAYCSSFYCMSLWTKYSTTKSLAVVKRAYNCVFRNFMRIKDKSTTSLNMVSLGIDHFNVIERKLVHGFRTRVLESENTTVVAITSSVYFNDSKIHSRWNKVLFNM